MGGLQWFKKEITFQYNDISVEAEIYYCSKDYKIKILKPVEIELPGSHLPYAAPARYVMNEANHIPNVKNIDISERCREEIIEALIKVKEEK